MQYSNPLLCATLIRRYQRFLADVELASGEVITVHTPNTGAMSGCSEPGSRVWLRDSANPKRKYRYSWELTENENGVLIGVNTGLPNTLVSEAIESGVIEELQGYPVIRQEVPYGKENSRIDLLLEGHDERPPCYVEIKNVTARDASGAAFFPDAVSARATKHLRELAVVVEDGGRAMLCFCVQRADTECVRPADEIDPVYGDNLREALARGVEAIAYSAEVSPREIRLGKRLPVVC